MTSPEVHQVVPERPDLLDALAAVRAETDREVNPEDPPAPPAELGGELFADSAVVRRRCWIATLEGVPVGELTLAVTDDDENRHLVDVEWLAVVPGMRRRGVADALVRVGLDWARADGRRSVVFWVPTLPDGSGAAYAARCGAAVATEERCSRLRIADLDHDLIGRWLDEGARRDDGYRLVQFVGPTPEEHLEAIAAAHRAMEDMPTDELDYTVPEMTTDKLRSHDAARARAGFRAVMTLAVAPDGASAGFSELLINGHRPELGSQGDTGVSREHRGHGLGRWLKAANLALALETEPRLAVVETFNAETNPWMLDINVDMGFRPHIGYQAFQGALDDALAAASG
jgi:mycothiol synthase